jgi:UDP-glucose 4-epimerase
LTRKNLITGGAGFIGSHLAEHLLQLGEDVVVWDDLSTGRMANLRRCIGNPRFRYIISDFTTDASFTGVVEQCDVIYHLAAAVGVQLIVNNPVRTIETNILGTEVALKAAAKFGTRVFIASTSEVYGKGTKVPFAEDDDVLYGPTTKRRWNYAISKAIDEFLLFAYHESHALPGVVGRFFNTVGPRQVPHYGMVIPRFIQQARRNEPITVYGDGTQSRCFGHVLDVVPAIYTLAHSEAARGKVVNIGSDQEITIADLARLVRDRTGSKSEIRYVPYEQAYRPGFEDMQRRVPDLTRAARLIGYRPTRTVADAIDDILADDHE